MSDNFQLRDGNTNLFGARSKDVSAAQDGSLQFMRHLAAAYPVDYGVGGCFHMTSKSGSMGAGLSANSPIYSFRWTSATLNALVRRIRLQAWSLGTGFTAGLATFDLYRATAWSAADTGGTTDTLGLDNGNLRTAMPASALAELRHSSTGALSAGTRTKDNQPADSITLTVGTATNTPLMSSPLKLFERLQGEHPLVLATNEGFTIQATVPATGVWAWAITAEWDEVPLVNF